MPRAALERARKVPCIICGKKSDACHIRSKGAGGKETDDNLLSMCRGHHTEQHRRGWVDFLSRYPKVAEVLRAKGWRLREEFGQTKLRRD